MSFQSAKRGDCLRYLLLRREIYLGVFTELVKANGDLESAAQLRYPMLSLAHFSRIFAKRIGISHRRAAFTIRMELAAIVIGSDRRTSEFSDLVGYSLLKNWDVSFASQFRMSPNQ